MSVDKLRAIDYDFVGGMDFSTSSTPPTTTTVLSKRNREENHSSPGTIGITGRAEVVHGG
jgi:hypothetical protein